VQHSLRVKLCWPAQRAAVGRVIASVTIFAVSAQACVPPLPYCFTAVADAPQASMPVSRGKIVTGAAPLRRPIIPHHADRQDFGLIEVRKLLAQIGKRQFDLRTRIEITERRDRHRVGDIEMPAWRRELGAGAVRLAMLQSRRVFPKVTMPGWEISGLWLAILITMLAAGRSPLRTCST